MRRKCNGAKSTTEASASSVAAGVGERSSCAEAIPKGVVERGEVRMPV